ADYRDVSDVVAPRQPVEWRMCLDEPSVLLRGEIGQYFVEVAREHVEPGRDFGERAVELGRLKNQEPADHLRPGRTALGRRRDDDVVSAELESFPARAIGNETVVVPLGRLHLHGRGSPWCLSSMSVMTVRINSSASSVRPPSTPP